MNRTATAITGLATVAATMLGVTTATTSAPELRACAAKDDGTLRLVDAGERCHRGEVPVRWNRRGPQGTRGPQGPAGASALGVVTTERQTSMSFAPAGNGSNWADGPGAFASATTTTQSTGFGVATFGAVTSGDNNTGIGYGAGRTVTTGYGNTAAGTAAMYNAGPAAFFNVAMGLHAGRWITGAGNVILGADAGRAAQSISETVIIGHDAYAGGGGRVAIGSGAEANHPNSVAIGQGTTTTGSAQVSVGPRDVEVTDPTKGIILRSPNGTRFRITVGDDGTLTTVPVG